MNLRLRLLFSLLDVETKCQLFTIFFVIHETSYSLHISAHNLAIMIECV